MKLKLKSLIALGLTSLFVSGCEQGSSTNSAINDTTIKFAGNASFAMASSTTSPDCSFGGTTLLNGDSVIAYQNSTVNYGEICASEIRVCTEGLLSGSYNYDSCSATQPASCLFNGTTIPHGETIYAYDTTSVELGGECISEPRTCNNGILSGSSPYASCGVNLPAACLFNGLTIPSGNSIEAFLTSSVPSGEFCVVETRYCLDGALSGSHQYASCSVSKEVSCLFNGQTIAHGQNLVAFVNSSVGFGETCQEEIRTCNNGYLSGSNQYASCVTDQPASCLFNGTTYPHGSNVTAYLSSTTTSGELCTAEERICNNGSLSGSYEYASCNIEQAAACLFNGQTIAHGSSVIAFNTSSVNYGESCSSENRVCNNGVLTGSNEYASCEINSASACLFNGQTISNGQTVVGYQYESAQEGSSCKSEVKTCLNGTLTGSYQYTNCSVLNDDDSDESEHEDKNDSKEKYCKKERVVKDRHILHELQERHDNNGLHFGWCKEKNKVHYDCGKHLGWYKDKKKKTKNTSKKKNKS